MVIISMKVLIRGICNKNNVEKLKDIDNILDVNADFIGQEFRTQQNTLSCWEADLDNQDSIKEAIIALVLANTQNCEKIRNNEKIERLDYIILDAAKIEELFSCKETDPQSKSSFLSEDLKRKHHDINISNLNGIIYLATLYKDIVTSDKSKELVVRLTKHQINEYICEWTKEHPIPPCIQ